MKIKQWVIMRYNHREIRTEIFCKIRNNYEFRPVDDIGNAGIVTYGSKQEAFGFFMRDWYVSNYSQPDFAIECVEVMMEVPKSRLI